MDLGHDTSAQSTQRSGISTSCRNDAEIPAVAEVRRVFEEYIDGHDIVGLAAYLLHASRFQEGVPSARWGHLARACVQKRSVGALLKQSVCAQLWCVCDSVCVQHRRGTFVVGPPGGWWC